MRLDLASATGGLGEENLKGDLMAFIEERCSALTGVALGARRFFLLPIQDKVAGGKALSGPSLPVVIQESGP